MTTYKAFFASLLLTALSACQQQTDSATHVAQLDSVDLVIKNARIYTSNSKQPWATSLAVRDGKFLYVGDDNGITRFKGATLVNLEGSLLIPGMVDGHAHPGYVNVESFGEVEGDTRVELLAAVKTYAAEHPEKKWLRLCCWPTAMFVEGSQGPRKQTLDALVPDRPVWFESETAHDFWLNSKALAELGVDASTPDPKAGLAMYARDDGGAPTGWIKEGAGVKHFARHFPVKEEAHIQLHKDSVANTLQTLSRHGVTTIYDAGNKGYGDHVYSVIAQLEQQGRLPVRYFGTYQIFTPDRARTAIEEVKRYRRDYGGTLLQFNSVKVFMDGISANQSASYSQPYLGSGTSTEPLLSSDELSHLLLQLHEEKLDLMVHSIGDLATKTVLDAVEKARAQVEGEFYPRVTVAHLAYVDPADIPRIAQLGLIANFSPWWFGVETDDVVAELLGDARYSQMYRAKSVVESGATVTYSSDEWWGGDMLATYISPYLGMQTGHTRQYPKDWWQTDDDGIRAPVDERLSLEQMLQGYTQGGAYQLRLENDIGSIETGKQADFVVLDRDIFTIDPHDIWQTKPTAVVVGGEVLQGSLTP